MIENIIRIGRTSLLSIAFGLAMSGCVQKNNHVSPSAPPPPPTTMQYLDHTVQFSGETLAAIAQWYTGRTTNWMAIRDANPGLNPNRLRLGQLIRIPDTLLMRRQPLPRDFLRKFNGGADRPPTTSPTSDTTTPNENTSPSGEATNPSGSSDSPASDAVAPSADDSVKPSSTPAEITTPPATSNPAGSEKPAVGSEKEKPANDAATPEDAEREKLLDELLN